MRTTIIAASGRGGTRRVPTRELRLNKIGLTERRTGYPTKMNLTIWLECPCRAKRMG